MNHVALIGRLGSEPRMRTTAGGNAVATLRIATGYKRRDGAEFTEWHTVKVFGVAAQNCQKYLKSGQNVAVEGHLHHYSVEREDGSTAFFTEVIASSVTFL